MKDFITFEIDHSDELIEIHLDKKGLYRLIDQLNYLKAHDNHIHLMTPKWGRDDLSGELMNDNNKIINHVKIHYWNDKIE